MNMRHVRIPETYAVIERSLRHNDQYRRLDSDGKKSMIWLEMLDQHIKYWDVTWENEIREMEFNNTQVGKMNPKNPIEARDKERLARRVSMAAARSSKQFWLSDTLYSLRIGLDPYDYKKVISMIKRLKLEKLKVGDNQKIDSIVEQIKRILSKNAEARAIAIKGTSDVQKGFDEFATRIQVQNEMAASSGAAPTEIEWVNFSAEEIIDKKNKDNLA